MACAFSWPTGPLAGHDPIRRRQDASQRTRLWKVLAKTGQKFGAIQGIGGTNQTKIRRLSQVTRRLTLTGATVLVTLALLFALMIPANPAQAAPGATTPTTVYYPLPPKSTADQLSQKSQRKLSKIRSRAENIIGDKMDQPNGLNEIQTVSAHHIRKVFRKSLGKAAWRSAIRISWRESRLLPHVVNDENKNKTMDWGLFQLNDGGTLQFTGNEPSPAVLHPRKNAVAARYLVRAEGWRPWGGIL